jgi:hypothetical protein
VSSERQDETFHLDPAIRAGIAPHFDAAALERLLQYLDPADRAFILDPFLLPSYRTTPPVPNQSFQVIGSSDSRVNELLAEVWQPFWASQPDEALDDPSLPYPGRELARERRTMI